MLDEIRVENLGILDDVTIHPGPGLIVFSGETGAGKTMLLGALRLLTGSAAQVGGKADSMVEGRFVVDDREMVLSRRIANGRSRGYLDGAMVPAKRLEDETAQIVEIVGQHDKHQLSRPAALRKLIDARLESTGPLDDYRAAWEQVQQLRDDLLAVGGDRRALERERDLLIYQRKDIRSAGFHEGDDERLRAEAARLRNAAELIERLSRAQDSLTRGADELGVVVDELKHVADIDHSTGPLLGEAEESAVRMGELSTGVRQLRESLDHDPAALNELELRLSRLGDLRRKYGDTLHDVLEFAVGAEERVAELDALLKRSETLGGDLEAANVRLEDAGKSLRVAREHAGKAIEQEALVHLRELGFADPVLVVDVEEADATAGGADVARIRFSSDRRIEPGPVDRVASGGELSRLVLALHLASSVGDVRVSAFDEIDAGVGGETAFVLGRKLAKLAQTRQVLCVTHLPQVAAFATRQFVVTREGNRASVRAVEGEDRLRELTRMLAGLPESRQGRNHAAELIAAARGQGG